MENLFANLKSAMKIVRAIRRSKNSGVEQYCAKLGMTVSTVSMATSQISRVGEQVDAVGRADLGWFDEIVNCLEFKDVVNMRIFIVVSL